MNNKKEKRIDIHNVLIITFIFVSIVFISLSDSYIWGSYLDWIDQHSVIPDYFRTLFYSTKDLFPDLALNLGAGQNIYNFAYYGLLNPIIMISYILPFISMKSFIMVSTLLLVYSSVILFYYFLRSNKFDNRIAFISSLVFMCASPLLFHSHRHIMFINYMPFLILALIGVDKYFKNNNKWLLSLSVFIIIMMSFYYSIPSILCIIVYGIYKYLSGNKKITFKSFIKNGFRFCIPIIIGVLMSSILILPEFYAIIIGRMDSPSIVKIKDLIIPGINVSYITYYSYGVGLTSLGIIALISSFFTKKREKMFLSITLFVLIVFPFFNYLLNGFMYIDAKALIPFLPLYVFLIAMFFKNLYKNNINIKYITIISVVVAIISFITKTYKYDYFFYEIALTLLVLYFCCKKKNYELFYIYTIIIIFVFSLISSSADRLVLKNDIMYDNEKTQEELVNSITTDDDKMYRITTLVDKNHTSNLIFNNINMYQNSIYSSIYNKNYNKFFYDVFENPVQSRNRVLTTPSGNILFLMFMSNKYLLSDSDQLVGYIEHENKDNIKSYINNDVLPFMYVRYNTFNKEAFDNIEFPFTNEVLLNYAVTEDGKELTYDSNIKKFSPTKTLGTNVDIKELDNTFIITANDESNIKLSIPKEAQNKIILIRFNMNINQSCRVGDQAIIINGMINKLTCREWKYYNGNTTFTYVISNKIIDELNIEFYEGKYQLSDIELYYLDYKDIKNVNDSVTEVNIDKHNTKGDKIIGNVVAEDDGYLVTSIPYQKGFEIYINGYKTEYEEINGGFIGFKVNKGENYIIFNFEAPYKRKGIVLSFIGLILFSTLILSSVLKKHRK